jgi:Domain of unknown function (DUF1707)
MATQPSLRIGDRERDSVAAELQEHFAHGRLTLEEFNQRIDAVFAAKTQSDLSRITADLPHVRSGGAPLPSSRRAPMLASGPPAAGWPGHGTVAAGSPALVAGAHDWSGPAWAGPGSRGGDWSGSYRSAGHRQRGGFAALTTLLSALASWLIVYHVVLVGLQFPWAGRMGLLIAIFTVIRGLLRRIFRGPRGRR